MRSRVEIMEIIGYDIEVGTIIRVKKNDELPINIIVTKISRGWYQGLKLILKCEELEKAAIILKKGKDVLYAMPTSYAQYVGVETNSVVKGIRKKDCVGAEGYIVGKVINQKVLDSILKFAKADKVQVANTDQTKQPINFEEVVETASSRAELLENLRLDNSFLRKALLIALEGTCAMKPVIAELQKNNKLKGSEIKRELNADLSIWIAKNNVEMMEYSVSYLLRKVAEAKIK